MCLSDIDNLLHETHSISLGLFGTHVFSLAQILPMQFSKKHFFVNYFQCLQLFIIMVTYIQTFVILLRDSLLSDGSWNAVRHCILKWVRHVNIWRLYEHFQSIVLLLSFRKCRLEGDFQKSIGRSSEVAYSLMDENGGIDSGIITPADMLSFARQVAMAMASIF